MASVWITLFSLEHLSLLALGNHIPLVLLNLYGHNFSVSLAGSSSCHQLIYAGVPQESALCSSVCVHSLGDLNWF